MVVIVRAPRPYASRSVIEATRTVVGLLNTVVTTCDVGPNITGTFTHNGLEVNNLVTTGAFYHAGQGAHGEGSGYPGATIGFNSNLKNSIYSDVINTVQPPSLVTLACIKT